MKKLLKQCSPYELSQGNFGLEREALRVRENGELATTPHPKVFGDKLKHPYITTDFAESQIELITPVFSTPAKAHEFLTALYDITALELESEWLWPQSMPCIVHDEAQVPLASYEHGPNGESARAYREHLAQRYGVKKQLISGIHFNFSFADALLEKWYHLSDSKLPYRTFKDNVYLKLVRQYLRYRWLLVYLFGATSTLHESYCRECESDEQTVSLRNSQCGYQNEKPLYAQYQSISAYVASVENFMKVGEIYSPKEFYNQIRLKAKDETQTLTSLLQDGVQYVEMRTLDINPFDKAGVAKVDLEFLQLFSLFLLTQPDDLNADWQEEAQANYEQTALKGRVGDCHLLRDGQAIKLKTWGLELLTQMQSFNKELALPFASVLTTIQERITDPSTTYAAKIARRVKQHGYVKAHMILAKNYYSQAQMQAYRLQGFEHLELSTQILIRDAIKHGLQVEVLDETDNFIMLRQGEHVEYIQQATKTSLDSYSSVLVMENKVVTKTVLERAGIPVPQGQVFQSISQAQSAYEQFGHRGFVVKPKSTNFGLGISIFTQGCSLADYTKALDIAFAHDHDVIVEAFVPGKEYRFLIIDQEVVGVLHRVPANVIGNGNDNLRELVAKKNLDPLRGVGYKTPLEKINLDESARLFLAQQHLNFDSIPAKDQIVYLRENSNISTGGDSLDFTDEIHQGYFDVALAAAAAVDANICGVDMMIEERNKFDEHHAYAIIELNFNPAIHIHCFPFKGSNRQAGVKILQALKFLQPKQK